MEGIKKKIFKIFKMAAISKWPPIYKLEKSLKIQK
jgi:hypothetical protein